MLKSARLTGELLSSALRGVGMPDEQVDAVRLGWRSKTEILGQVKHRNVAASRLNVPFPRKRCGSNSSGPLNAKQPGLVDNGIGRNERERDERRCHLGENGDYARHLQRAIREDAEESLRSLRHRRRRAAAARQTGLTLITARHAAFVHAGNTTLASAQADGLMMTRRLLHQGAHATRRLQELLHECLGEYEKVRLTATRRRRASAETRDSVLREKIIDLRWARFCSRLGADTFGLTKVLDLGSATGDIPAAAHTAAAAAHAFKTEPSRRGNAGWIENSSSLHVNTAASTIASRLEPLLERAGVVCPRILRVIALYPRRVAAGGRGRESERGKIGCSVNDSLITYDRRCEHGRQKPGVDTAARESTAGENLEGRDSAAVVVVTETNTPLGVLDVLRRAVLCGNGALRAALVDDDAFLDLKSCQGSERGPENNIDAMSDMTAAVTATAGRGRETGGENKEPVSGGQGSMIAGFPGDIPSPRELPNVEGCRIVEADPDLLLSSSSLAWVLHPSFCGSDRAQLSIFARSQNGASNRINGDVRAGGDGGFTGSSEESPGHSHAVHSNTMKAWDDMLGQVRKDEVSGGGGIGHEVSGDVGAGRTSWRTDLTQEVAWLGASPVGSRLYYCLEEAEWDASQHEKTTKPKTGTTTTTPASPPAAEPGVISEREGTCLARSTEDWNSDAKGQGARRTSAMMFARSVSEMLAEVYIREDRTKPVRASTVAEKRSSRREKGGQRSKPRDSIVADCVCGGAIAVGPEAASWVVSGTVDKHRQQARRFERSNETKTDKQVVDAVAALPDVLLASVSVSRKKSSRFGMAGGGRADNAAEPRETCASAASTNARRLRPKKDRSAAAMEDNLEGHKAQATEAVILHFAPAHVLQLLGTPQYREFVESLPPTTRAKIRHKLAYDDAALGSRAARPPPVKRLYVPLASPVSGSMLLPPARDPLTPNPGLEESGYYEDDMAAAPNAACLPDLTSASAEFTCGASPCSSASPLIGALLHPLPARAMRELFQLYVATTRRFSSSSMALNGDGLRPTSGFFFTSSPDNAFLPTALCDLENQPRNEQDKGARNKAVHVEHRQCPRSTTSGSESKPTSPLTLSTSSPLLEDSGEASLQSTARVNAGPLMLNVNEPAAAGRTEAASRSCNLGQEEQQERENGIGGNNSDFCRSGSSAGVPPSAVDIIPDSINLSDYDGVRMRRCSASMSCIMTAHADAMKGCFVGDDEPGGVGAGNNPKNIRRESNGGGLGGGGSDRPRRIAKTCADNQLLEPMDGSFGAIASSLRTEYRRSYVAVLASRLAPTLPTPATAAAGNGHSNMTNVAIGRGNGYDCAPDDLFSGASALFVQLEDGAVPTTARGRSTEQNDCRRSQLAGVGQDHDRGGGANPSGTIARAARGGELPTVCLWRGCLSGPLFETPLCAVHARQKEFLDAKAAKARSASEASRFLPPGCLGNTNKKRRPSLRKRCTGAGGFTAAAKTMGTLSTALSGHSGRGGGRPGHDGGDEIAAASAMSPLLSELFSGKLASTIGTFCLRAVAESRQQHRQRGRRCLHSVRRPSSKDDVEEDGKLMESRTTSDQQIVEAPRWARWADASEVEAADRKLESEVQWAKQVLEVEKEVTTELRRLSGLGVYPAAELARIRQEHEKLSAEWRQAVGRPYGSFAIEGAPGREPGIGEEEESCVESVAGVSTSHPRGGDKPRLAPLASGDSSSMVAPVRSRAVGTGCPSFRTTALEPRSDVVLDRIAGSSATPVAASKVTADVATNITAKTGKRRALSQVQQQQTVNTGGTLGRCSDGGYDRQTSAEEGWSSQAREAATAAWSSQGVARREAEIELTFCEMKRTLLKRRRKEAELATRSPGTMVPPYEAPCDPANAGHQPSHSSQRDLRRSPLAPSTSSTSSWGMALDVSGRGSSVTIGSTRYSIAAFSTGAAADDCPSSPAGHQLLRQRQQHQQRGRHQPPSSASSSRSTSPGKKHRPANAPAVDGSRLREESSVRHSINSHYDHVHRQHQQQNYRRRHSSPPRCQSTYSSDSLLLGAGAVVAGQTTASRSNTFTIGGGPHGRFNSLSLGGHMGSGRHNGTEVVGVVKRDNAKGFFNKGAGIGVGGRRRASSLPRRRASTGGGGGGGSGYSVGSGSMMPWGGSGGGKGFDAAPYQTTVLFRDR